VSRLWAGSVALFLLSLALRLAFLHGVDPRETLRADGWHYTMLAWSLAHRGAYSDSVEAPLVPHMRWPPGYPALLAPFYRGRDLLAGTAAALSVQVVAGAAIPVLTALTGARLGLGPLAWLAGILAAGCPILATTPAFPVTETAFTLLLLGLLLVLFRLVERPGMGAAVAAGLLGAVLAMVRSSALALVGAAAAWLALRAPGPGARRAALVLVVLALAPAVAWEVRFHVEAARGTPAPSYLAPALAQGIYPDLVYADSPRGYAMQVDPAFPHFSVSIARTLGTAWERARADPWRHLRWHLVDRWLVLWEFGMIQSPPIHVYPVVHGLFRPATINPGATGDEPLAALYWIFRALWYWCIVPAVALGAVLVARPPASRFRELGYVLLAVHVALHGMLIPEPRFMVPMRPLLFVLALAALSDVATWGTRRAAAAVLACVMLVAAAGWTSAAIAERRAPAARRAGAALVTDGQRLQAAGDVAGALAAYEAARTADPRNVEASMLAGLVYHYQLDDPARAVPCYRAVLAERPDHYGAHYHLATALLADGRTAEARAAWASFARLAEAIGDRATIASAPPPLRDALPAR
jgi:Tetratricopeptide repeat